MLDVWLIGLVALSHLGIAVDNLFRALVKASIEVCLIESCVKALEAEKYFHCQVEL